MRNISIGAVSDATGVKVTTIRFYEDRGLLPAPPRTSSGRRQYDTSHVARLKFIKHARQLGFDMDAIAALLALSDRPDQDCAAADSIACQQIAQITTRIAQLQGLQAELTRMVQECAGGPISVCRVIECLGEHGLCDELRHNLS